MINLTARRATCCHAINFTIHMPEHIPWTETFRHQNDSIKSIITGMGISVQHSFCEKKMGSTLEILFFVGRFKFFVKVLLGKDIASLHSPTMSF
jgi:hypothetical protein